MGVYWGTIWNWWVLSQTGYEGLKGSIVSITVTIYNNYNERGTSMLQLLHI